ncbi:pectate lyase [Rhizobium sp. BT03]|uniref:pectate lyase n=1 Tax=Rhizobium sp. BT03 TaxID=3045156 RepID=UPI0024B3CF12|nr:pectate lyase [Rhizobium sp. BT03]WHO77098.1 pectate lyase [Rhizobium sp. BT03]
MHGVDGQRPIDFDRTSHFDLESGCHGGSNRIDTDFTTSRTRKVSPFEDSSGNPPMLSSYVPKSRETSESGVDSDAKDVLRKHINWQSDSKKLDPSDEKQTTTLLTTAEKPDLSNEGSVITVNEPIVVDGGVFDGKGATYTASSKLGDGGQSETQSPLFILKNGATLKNVNLGENGADGIHVYGGATLENVNWQNVGEDALTVKSAGDVTILGGSAKGATDKIFQINADTHFHLKDFVADGFTTLVRTNGGKQIDADVTIDGGAFSNGSNVFRTDSSLASVTFLSDITLDKVKNWTRVGDNQSGV